MIWNKQEAFGPLRQEYVIDHMQQAIAEIVRAGRGPNESSAAGSCTITMQIESARVPCKPKSKVGHGDSKQINFRINLRDPSVPRAAGRAASQWKRESALSSVI